jgi:glycosyltransferase involved in cell wall biosynthesis
MLVTRYDGVWIIIPAFNEAPVIADVVSVDDASHDDTAARALGHRGRHPR